MTRRKNRMLIDVIVPGDGGRVTWSATADVLAKPGVQEKWKAITEAVLDLVTTMYTGRAAVPLPIPSEEGGHG